MSFFFYYKFSKIFQYAFRSEKYHSNRGMWLFVFGMDSCDSSEEAVWEVSKIVDKEPILSQ